MAKTKAFLHAFLPKRRPFTAAGRIVAMMLMVVSVGLFGVLTGLFARFVIESDVHRDDDDLKELAQEILRLCERLESIETQRGSTHIP